MKRILLVLSVLFGLADVAIWQWTLAVNRARIVADTPPPLEYSTTEIVVFYFAGLTGLLAILAQMKRFGSGAWSVRTCKILLALWILRGIGVADLSQTPLDSWSLRRTEAQANHLVEAICAYVRDRGSFPVALSDLRLADSATRDAWGFKFGMTPLGGPGGVRLFARGVPLLVLRDPLWHERVSRLSRDVRCNTHAP